MSDYKIWKSNILSAIKHLSNIDYQKNVWLSKSDDQISSFDEDIMVLYDDNCFDDDFWNDTHLPKFNFNEVQINVLKEFKRKLDEYLIKIKEVNSKLSDQEIISDPEWVKIAENAKNVLTYFK